MIILAITFVLLFAAWVTAIRAVLDEQSLERFFFAILSSTLLYLNAELIMWALGVPFGVMLFIGILPIIAVVYGFRVYDYRQQAVQEKVKNDEKIKREGA